MAVSEDAKRFVLDLLDGLPDLRVQPMFGGAGVMSGKVMFGLLADETLYLKVDDETEPRFRDAGSEPFAYDTKDGRRMAMRYWRCPEVDDAEAARGWARLALDSALAKRAAGKPKGKAKSARPELLISGPWDDD